MSLSDSVKQSTDLAVVGTAVTINVATLNEWVTLTAGVLACVWSVIRIIEWVSRKSWRNRRAH